MRHISASQRWRGGRGGGVAASLSLHLLVLTLLGLALRHAPPIEAGRSLQVSLVTLSGPSTEARRQPPAASQPAIGVAAPQTNNPPPVSAPPPVVAAQGPPLAAPAAPPDLSKGLRLLVGCAHPDDDHLTAAERDDCARASAHAHAPGGSYDPGAWYASDGDREAHDRAVQRAIEDSTDARLEPQQQPLSENCRWLRCRIGRP